MFFRFYLKYFLIGCILLLASCDSCDYASAAKANSKVTTATGGWTGMQRLPEIFSDVIVDKLFGCVIGSSGCSVTAESRNMHSVNDGKGGTGERARKGLIRNRAFETGIIYSIYKSVISSFEYRAAYYLAFLLYLTVLGVTYLLGMSKMTMDKLVPIVIKVGVISLFTNPTVTGQDGLPIGWGYYYNFIVAPSLYAMEQFAMYFLSVLFAWNINDVENGFLPLTVILSFFASAGFWVKITSLILTNLLMGLPTFLMILFVMASYLVMMLFAIIAYVTVLAMLGMLFALGPFFFVFLFFEKTKQFFFKWMSNIISLMLQQYTLFITVAIFGFIIAQSIEAMLGFDLKCTPIISFNFAIPTPDWLRSFLYYSCKVFTLGFGSCSIPENLIHITKPIWSYYTAAIPDNSSFISLFMYSLFLYMLVKLFGAMVQYASMLGQSLVPNTVNAGKGGAADLQAFAQKGLDKVSGVVSGGMQDGAKSVLKMPYNAATGQLGSQLKGIFKGKDGKSESGDDKGSAEKAGEKAGGAAGKEAGQEAGRAAGNAAGGAITALTGGTDGGISTEMAGDIGAQVGGAVGEEVGSQVGGAAGKVVDETGKAIQNAANDAQQSTQQTVTESSDNSGGKGSMDQPSGDTQPAVGGESSEPESDPPKIIRFGSSAQYSSGE
jgi:type IV secretory pathway VirB6-like protein